MRLESLTFEKIKTDVENFKLMVNDSYVESYQEFIRYFENIQKIEKHHLIISSHFVYGWMPTILHLDFKTMNQVLLLLNNAKSSYLLKDSELEIIKYCINNSLVGTSKLLHFINPTIYAIWDSKIYRYLTEKKNSHGIDNVNTYLEYLKRLDFITKHEGYNEIHSKVEEVINYRVSSLRAIEIVMFMTQKNKIKEI